MSDCSTRAYDVPDTIKVPRMYPLEIVQRIERIDYGGIYFRKEVTCTMTEAYRGTPCSDWECSACGKIHNAPRTGRFCPRCGAKIVEVKSLGPYESRPEVKEIDG